MAITLRDWEMEQMFAERCKRCNKTLPKDYLWHECEKCIIEVFSET